MVITTHMRDISKKEKEIVFGLIEKYKTLSEEDYNNSPHLRASVASDIIETGRHLKNLRIASHVLYEDAKDYDFVESIRYLT